MRCPNRSQTSMIPTSCCRYSQTALRKSTVRSALLPYTTINTRLTIISISSFRKGCRIVQKEGYERILFAPKDKLFKQQNFLDEAKHFYTDHINHLVRNEHEKLHVFDKDGLYPVTKKSDSGHKRLQKDRRKILHRKKTEERDNRPLIYTNVISLSCKRDLKCDIFVQKKSKKTDAEGRNDVKY